jgi:hypothetical protein
VSSDREARARRVDPDVDLVAEFGADYADAFALATSSYHPAREWAYGALRGSEAAGGAFGRFVWGGALGFRLTTDGNRDTLVGWHITIDEPKRIVIDTDGRLMAGRIVFVVAPAQVTWTTMLRFHRRAGARIWSVAGNAHRALAPRCLNSAARHVLGYGTAT